MKKKPNGMKSRSGSISVHEFILPEWEDCIFIEHNALIAKNAQRLIEMFEATAYHDEGHQGRRISRQIPKQTAYCLEPGDQYDWHSDTLMMTLDGDIVNARGDRYWTQLTYVSEANALEIGNWNSKGKLLEYDMGTMNIPEPSEVIARIAAKPGRVVTFPSPFLHRVQPPIEKRRWAIVNFDAPRGFKPVNYIELMKRYMNEDFRRKLLSSR